MGLIKAAVESVGSTLHDQWKDYIRCEDLGNEILMKKVTTKNGIISKDSAIQVSPGQIAVIFDSGKVLDATAEEGIYTFDQSLKKCGLVLYMVEEFLRNKLYSILMLKR